MTLNNSKSISSVTEVSILGYRVGYGVMKTDPERLKPLHELPPPTSKKALQRAMGLFAYYAKWIPCFSDKIPSLKAVTTFPLDERCLNGFQLLKRCIGNGALQPVDKTQPFVVECDAFEVAISATLNQGGRPVAFMSRSLSGSELYYPAVEEVTAIIEAGKKMEPFSGGASFHVDHRPEICRIYVWQSQENESQTIRFNAGAWSDSMLALGVSTILLWN